MILWQNVLNVSKFWWPWNYLKVTSSHFAVWLVCTIALRITTWSLSYHGLLFNREVSKTYKILVTLKWPQGHKQLFCNLAFMHHNSAMQVIAFITYNIILYQNLLDISKFWWPLNDLKVTSSHFVIWLINTLVQICMWLLS